MANLKSLFINLHKEEHVDLIMDELTNLEELNGVEVVRVPDEQSEIKSNRSIQQLKDDIRSS